MLPTPILLTHVHLSRRLWGGHAAGRHGSSEATPPACHDGNPGIRPGSGTAQGSEGAADPFHRVYHKRIDKWSGHLELLQEALIFKPPPSVPDLFHSSVFMTHNLRRRCASHLDHHGAGPHIVKSDGEQCCPGQRAGWDGAKHSEALTLCLLRRSTCQTVHGCPQRQGGASWLDRTGCSVPWSAP